MKNSHSHTHIHFHSHIEMIVAAATRCSNGDEVAATVTAAYGFCHYCLHF